MELSKRNLIIVGGVILFLLLGIVIIGNKPKKPVVTKPDPNNRDFNVVEKKEEIVVFNTPTPTPTLIPTPTPTLIPTPTPTLIPTPTPTLIPTPTPTPVPTDIPPVRIIPTRRPTRIPTPTPTPDTSIKATGVSLNTTQLNLEINQTYQILSKVEPDDTTNKSVSWSSSDSNVATVDNNGNVTGKNLGDTIVIAKTSNGKTTMVKVTVINTPQPITEITSSPVIRVSIYPENIKLNYNTVNLKVNQTQQLRLDIKPVDVTDYSTRWSSSNSNVAIVSIWGMVMAKSPGITVISAKTVNGLVDTATITVIGDKVTPATTPTPKPTQRLTPVPSRGPTSIPTHRPTPTYRPTATPTPRPTATPTRRPTPTYRPTATPTKRPTATPTRRPTPTYRPTAIPTNKPTSYVLVWSDEFNGTALDTTKWTVAANCHDNWNDEDQCYTADAVSVSGGNLIIKSERRKIGSYNFTSGLVKSDGSTSLNGNVTAGPGKYTFKYGKIEFRVKLPAGGQGIWPALWLIPPPYSNPPEVDIIEGYSDMSKIFTNYWWGDSSKNQQSSAMSYQISSPSTTFHIFGFEWEPGVMRWYHNGDLKRTFANPVVTDIPMYILMNTALGGAGTNFVGDSTPFPQYFLIDYVRVYQKK